MALDDEILARWDTTFPWGKTCESSVTTEKRKYVLAECPNCHRMFDIEDMLRRAKLRYVSGAKLVFYCDVCFTELNFAMTDNLEAYFEIDAINQLRGRKDESKPMLTSKLRLNNNAYNAIVTKPKKVVFNDPYTTVLWSDDTITQAICSPDDKFDEEIGFAMCVRKKAYGKDYTGRLLKRAERQSTRKQKRKNG